MRKTSFGFMESFGEGEFLREKLTFEKTGRFHKHHEIEIFKVLSGTGLLFIEDEISNITAGCEYTVPSGALHKMSPLEGQTLEVEIKYKTAPKL